MDTMDRTKWSESAQDDEKVGFAGAPSAGPSSQAWTTGLAPTHGEKGHDKDISRASAVQKGLFILKRAAKTTNRPFAALAIVALVAKSLSLVYMLSSDDSIFKNVLGLPVSCYLWVRSWLFTEIHWQDQSLLACIFGAVLPEEPRTWMGRFMRMIQFGGGSESGSSSGYTTSYGDGSSYSHSTSSSTGIGFALDVWTAYWIGWYAATVYFPFLWWRGPALFATFCGSLDGPEREHPPWRPFGGPPHGLGLLPLMFSDLLAPLGKRIHDQGESYLPSLLTLSPWIIALPIFAIYLNVRFNDGRPRTTAESEPREVVFYIQDFAHLCLSWCLLAASNSHTYGPFLLFNASQVCFSLWSAWLFMFEMSDYRRQRDVPDQLAALFLLLPMLFELLSPNLISQKALQ